MTSKELSYFASSYKEARNRFLEVTKNASLKESLYLFKDGTKMKGIDDEELAIDIACFGNVKDPHYVLIHSSGTHGVEGYHGNAIQIGVIAKLDEYFKKVDESKTAIIFIHSVNPYGMSFIRRWNENNVDLNRNFFFKNIDQPNDDTPYKKRGTSNAYVNLNPLLNPNFDEIGYFDSFTFYGKAIYSVALYGFSSLKQAIAQGQCGYTKGLFFGGIKLEQSAKLLFDWLRDFTKNRKNIKRVVHIDVHSGLGKYGEDSLLVGKSSKEEKKILSDTFGERISFIDDSNAADTSVAYQLEGDIMDGIGNLFSTFGIQFFGICQEFGTYNPISVLKALRIENAAWHKFGEEMKKDHKAKINLLQTFYPQDDVWKLKVYQRGEIVFQTALELSNKKI